jgi:hypothetical protein
MFTSGMRSCTNMPQKREKLSYCGKITAIVILMSFLTMFPAYGEQPKPPPIHSAESGTRLYSGSEVDLLIEDLTAAAEEAIEKAAAEAAKAAAVAAFDREAEAVREARRWRMEAEEAKKRGRRNVFTAGLVCFLGGVAAGTLTVGIMGR